MQREETVDEQGLNILLRAIYEGSPLVCEAYSKYDSDIVEFASSEALESYMESEISGGNTFIDFAIYYPSTNGFIEKKKIDLRPEKCNGAKKRFSIEGWGLIQLQMDLKCKPKIKCRIAVNSEKRANAWCETYPELKSPNLWDWKMVEKNTRRLIRVLRKCA